METPSEKFRQKIYEQIDKTCEEFLNNDETKPKTITEFCIEVDEAKSMVDLDRLQTYLRLHGRKFSLIELRFISEHFQEKVWKIGSRR